jgi:SdrD B-like domain
MVIVNAGVSAAVHDEEFQLDIGPNGANTVDNPGAAEDFDWENFFNASGPGGTIAKSVNLPDASRPGFTASGGTADFALPDATTYATGSKDTLSIETGWQCSNSNNVGDKVDIVNAYAAAYVRPSDNHLILYYGVEKSSPLGSSNIATWFLKDGTVDCNSPGGATDFTGAHQDGDILLVSAFTNGGDTANVNAFRWNGNDATGSLGTTPIASGQLCGTGTDDACSTVNRVATSPPWAHPDKNGGALDAFEFFEGGVDVGEAGVATCFATAVMNTRSSASLTATLFDYARFSLPVCGELTVKKYIDVDLSGSLTAGDIESGAPVSDWSFTVTGPGADPTVRCSGTTDATGTLVCGAGQTLANLAPGTYHVTENQKTGFFNTDPGDADLVNVAATVTKDVAVGVSSATTRLGNTCFVDKTFQINGVPTGAGAPSSITVNHTIATGPTPFGSTGSLDLSDQGGGVWSGTVADTFVQTNTIDWAWFVNGDGTVTNTGGTGESLAGGAFPVCADTNTDTFPLSTLTGFKYKDVNNNGDFDDGTDLDGAGFTFDLKSGTTVLQTAVSEADGTYTFTDVAPGTYTVAERDETGWTQTEPAGNAADRTVVVPFNQADVTIGDFGNHPLSDISASFTPLAKSPPGSATPATQSTITCVDAQNNVVATGTSSATGSNLPLGTYTCTIVITDP